MLLHRSGQLLGELQLHDELESEFTVLLYQWRISSNNICQQSQQLWRAHNKFGFRSTRYHIWDDDPRLNSDADNLSVE